MIHPRQTAVRLLAGMLLVAALAAGLWWNSTRLNETERKLVGAWEIGDYPGRPALAAILLADRRHFSAYVVDGGWTCSSEPDARWQAEPHTLTRRMSMGYPSWTSPKEWAHHARVRFYGGHLQHSQITWLNPDEFLHRSPTNVTTFRRSNSPELLRLFDRLSAGEAP